LGLLLTCLIIFSREKKNLLDYIRSLSLSEDKENYEKLINAITKYAFLIKISMLDFFVFSKSSYTKTDFENKMSQLDTAYSYLFITTILAMISFVIYLILMKRDITEFKYKQKLNIKSTLGINY
jgi:hypothetical protein